MDNYILSRMYKIFANPISLFHSLAKNTVKFEVNFALGIKRWYNILENNAIFGKKRENKYMARIFICLTLSKVNESSLILKTQPLKWKFFLGLTLPIKVSFFCPTP